MTAVYFIEVRRVVNGRQRVWSLGPCGSPEEAQRLAEQWERSTSPIVALEDSGPSPPPRRRRRGPRCLRCPHDIYPHTAKECPMPNALRALVKLIE